MIDWFLDSDTLSLITPKGEQIKLSAKRYLLLNILIQNKNEVVSYKELLDTTDIKSKSSLLQIAIQKSIAGTSVKSWEDYIAEFRCYNTDYNYTYLTLK